MSRRRKIDEWEYEVDGRKVAVEIRMCEHKSGSDAQHYTFEAKIIGDNAPMPMECASLDGLREEVNYAIKGMSSIVWRKCLYLKVSLQRVCLPTIGKQGDYKEVHTSQTINIQMVELGEDRTGRKFAKHPCAEESSKDGRNRSISKTRRKCA